MTTSEFEYYLLAELIGMPNRVLAQQIELLVWNKCPIPNEPILEKFLALLEASENELDFEDKATEYVRAFGVEWTIIVGSRTGDRKDSGMTQVNASVDFRQMPVLKVIVSRGP